MNDKNWSLKNVNVPALGSKMELACEHKSSHLYLFLSMYSLLTQLKVMSKHSTNAAEIMPPSHKAHSFQAAISRHILPLFIFLVKR